MSKVLIVSHSLMIGGGERLVYELVRFALNNNLKPHVLIIDNYLEEYYDAILKNMGVPVTRTRVNRMSVLRNPKNLAKALLWRLRLRFFLFEFNSVHVVNLNMADKVKGFINHKNKYYWHVGNSVQYPDSKLPFSSQLFENTDATIVFINEYQMKEIEKQYGKINSKKVDFKLFIN